MADRPPGMADRPRASHRRGAGSYRGGVDPFDDLLRSVRADGAAFGRSVLTSPGALRFTDGAYMTLCTPLRGEGWIVRDGESRRVRLGEAAIVRGPDPFVFSSSPTFTACQDVRCDASEQGPATGDTVLLAGAYHVRGQAPRRLLRVLPPVIVVPDEDDHCAAIRDYLDAQLTAPLPGRRIVLDRFLDWLLVCALRDWFDRPEAAPPTWYRAMSDDVVGPVLQAMHKAPAEPWTLASLAAVAAVSRTTLAQRFTDLVGDPPLAYLTDWRMTLAADLLAETTHTVAAIARQVGYTDPFAFSQAFKRTHGLSPTAYRHKSQP